jgi:hypothetical protein
MEWRWKNWSNSCQAHNKHNKTCGEHLNDWIANHQPTPKPQRKKKRENYLSELE